MSDSNIILIAVPQKSRNCINIYLDFSGRREYLMYHRFEPGVYSWLKGGVRLSDARRWKRCKDNRPRGASVKLNNSIKHIILCAEDYLTDRESA